MIAALQTFVLGLLVAMWLGAILGFIRAWNGRAFIAIMGLLGGLLIASVFAAPSPSAAAGEMNWIYIAGTVPGYFLGFATGEIAYEEECGQSGVKA